MDVSKHNINIDASDASQTENIGTSKHSPKNPQSDIIQAEVIANNVDAEENKNMEDNNSPATSVNKENDSKDLVRKETIENKKHDPIENFETEPSVDKEDVSKDSNRLAPSVANEDNL
jgi:hypothetical protein